MASQSPSINYHILLRIANGLIRILVNDYLQQHCHNSPKQRTSQKSFGRWPDIQTCSTYIIQWCSAIKRNEVLICAPLWISLRNVKAKKPEKYTSHDPSKTESVYTGGCEGPERGKGEVQGAIWDDVSLLDGSGDCTNNTNCYPEMFL